MKLEELKIEGMSCHHCAMAVRKELAKLSGLDVIDVQVGRAKIEFDETKVSLEQVRSAVAEAGYKVVS